MLLYTNTAKPRNNPLSLDISIANQTNKNENNKNVNVVNVF